MFESLRVATLTVLVALLLMSCSAAPISLNFPSEKPWTNYSLGEVRTTPTGSTMMEGVDGAVSVPTYRLTGLLKVDGTSKQPPTSDIWSARYHYHGPCTGGRYVLTNPLFYQNTIGVIVTEDGSIPCERAVMRCTGAREGNTWPVEDGVGLRPFTRLPFSPEAGGVRWELVYSGRSGNEVGIAYREYSNGANTSLARPGFFQDLKYDVATSSRVVFRSIELEILEATNTGITFRVIGDSQRLPVAPVKSP
jgi:hypothetical protein